MALSIRTVKTRIVATKKTSQITKAMHMVSASKLRVSEKTAKEYQPLIEEARLIINNLVSSKEEFEHVLMSKREVKKICYVVISSDRGLAGAFNSNIIKELNKLVLNHNSKDEYIVAPLGTKAYTYCKKMKMNLIEENQIMLNDDIDFYQISNITKKIVMGYLMGNYDKVVIIHNHYVNTLVQEIKSTTLLPLSKEEFKSETSTNYEFEGGMKNILDILLPIYIENSIYGYVLDSKTSEHAARMNSMKNATDNASEVIESLELLYNRARQSAITVELTDIVSGAGAINNN